MSDDDAQHSTWWRNFWDKMFPVIVGGVLAIAGSYLATTLQVSAQAKAQKAEEQRKVFASLMGRKLVTEQLHLSRIEARVFSDYHEELWRRAGAPKESLDLQEGQRWMHKSEDLGLEIAKSNQALFEDLATVLAFFPNTPRLRELWTPIYKFKTIMLKVSVPHDGPIESVTQWKDGAGQEIQTLVESEYGKPIDELLEFLRTQLPQ